jgi:hypothetical protein
MGTWLDTFFSTEYREDAFFSTVSKDWPSLNLGSVLGF